MAGTLFRKTGMALIAVWKWMIWAVCVLLKLAAGIVKLSLLLFVISVAGVSSAAGVSAGRR